MRTMRMMNGKMATRIGAAAFVALVTSFSVVEWPLALAQTPSATAAPSRAVISGPVGPSPYDVVRGWQKPFASHGFAFGGNSGVFADSTDRIIIAQRGETRLPDPIPPAFAGFAGSIGINVLTPSNAGLRVWKNCFYTLDASGNVKERSEERRVGK